MNKQSTFIKNSLILLFGKVCTQFIAFFLLPLYTSNLSTAEYGIVDLITTYTTLLVPVITIQIEMALFRFLIDCRDDEKQKSIILSNAYWIVGIISLLWIIVGCFVIHFLSISYGIYLVLMVLFTISSNILLQSSRGIGDTVGYSLASIVTGVSNIVLNTVFFLYFRMGIYSVFLATILSNLICTGLLFVRNRFYRYCSVRLLSKKVMKSIVTYSLPLVPNGVVWWIINTSDRTFISMIIGPAANGIYSVSNKFSNIMNSFYGIFNMSWTEAVSLYMDDKDTFLQDSFQLIFRMICSMCLFLMNGMFLLFPLLVESKFHAAYEYIPLLILSTVFSMLSASLSSVYVAKKKTKEIAKTTVLASVINIILDLCLIRKYKIYAAVISTLVAFFVVFMLRYFGVQKYIQLTFKKSEVFIFSSLFLLSMIVYSCNHGIIQIVYFLWNVIFLVLLNKKEIGAVMKKFKSIIERWCGHEK